MTCGGTLIWFGVTMGEDIPDQAILECSGCDYVIVAGNYHRADHTHNDIVREGV